MDFQLTDVIIREAFAKTGVDMKYFPVYETEIKRCYEALQNDLPDDEDSTEEDNIVFHSLRLTEDYIKYYIAEIEKGHSHKWSHFYSLEEVSGMFDYECIERTLNQIGSDEEKEIELNIHIRAIDEDPIFVKRYKYLYREQMYDNLRKDTEDFCRIYYQCINNGKSENYAYAYADACNREISEYCWDIQAQAYELAKTQGMDDDSASSFAYCCSNAWANSLVLEAKSFIEYYHEKWQIDFYISMMKHEYSEREINEILRGLNHSH